MADEQAPDKKKKKKLPKTVLLIVGVMVVEAAGFFVGMKVLGSSPKNAYGENGEHYSAGKDLEEGAASVEIPLLTRFKAPNYKQGRTFYYDFDLTVVVSVAHKERVEKLIEERGAEIKDRAAQIIRKADPRILTQDDFETLRALFKRSLGSLLGDEQVIRAILFPRWMELQPQ